MTTALSSLKVVLCGSDGSQGLLQDSAYYTGITTYINDAVKAIAGGLRMPDGSISPPLPLLYDMDTIETSTSDPYKSLPSDYMRSVFMVADSSGNQLFGPSGGDYYSFGLFLRQASNKGLAQSGAISTVCVRANSLYYQGIPSSSKTLTVHFYREPTDMSDDTDTVDGLPDHLATRLIQHWVCKEIYSQLEDGADNQGVGYKIHSAKFIETMIELVDYIGLPDAVPMYYGEGSGMDLGIVD